MNLTAKLTRRQSEIAELFAWGATKKDIANRLFISTRTVENTARSIYERTEVTKVNELSAWWFCTHFNIPLSLNPLKKSIVAMFFLILFIPFEFYSNQSAVRSSRYRASECRENEARREDDIIYLYLN